VIGILGVGTWGRAGHIELFASQGRGEIGTAEPWLLCTDMSLGPLLPGCQLPAGIIKSWPSR
jgi:hypothetical protein